MSKKPVPVARPQKLFLLKWTDLAPPMSPYDATVAQVVRTTTESNECKEYPDWWRNPKWVSCTCIGSALGGEPDTVVIQDCQAG